MQRLKKLLRKPDKPLEQVVLRYQEISIQHTKKDTPKIEQFKIARSHDKGPLILNTTYPHYNILNLKTFKFNTKNNADSYFLSYKNEIVKVINIATSTVTGQIILIWKKFEHMLDMYDQPIKSSHFNIYIVETLSNTLCSWSVNDIKKK